jgi:UDP-N-acetylmuramoyl-tripeptide--D-alanyl-D-alanine ligase
MDPMTIEEAVGAMQAEITGRAPTGESIVGICTDTRQDAAGTLFFALRGENGDGHRFVPQAFSKGAAAAVVDCVVPNATGQQLLVRDTLIALGDLAAHYRRRFDVPVIGVTGSVGKTSTKEMIACALRARLNVLASDKNYNNEIGVPLTLFALSREHEAAVVEMGMRAKGEIARLAEIAQPTIGVITNIGLSHIERLGSREQIARAKGELLEGLPADGVAILPADDAFTPMLRQMAPGIRVLTCGASPDADHRITDISFSESGAPRFRINGLRIELGIHGAHHALNAAAAIAVAQLVGVEAEAAAEALSAFQAPAMRMETLEGARGITILNDAYNAAPDSMKAALETLARVAGSRRAVAILGEMRELGVFADEAHRTVGEAAGALHLGAIITVGIAAEEIGRAAQQAGAVELHCFASTEEAVDGVPSLLQPGDVALVKGSRAMEMERIVAALAR